MGINRDKPDEWKKDIAKSVDLYNTWFMNFAPVAFRKTRKLTARQVTEALASTKNLTAIGPEVLKNNPSVLPMLRMSTCPPIARDRLVGLAGVSKNLVECMEDSKNCRIPPRMKVEQLDEDLAKIGAIITKMADPDIFVWLDKKQDPVEEEINRAATIVADRLCGAISDPIIRNAQEQRQLAAISAWLDKKGYTQTMPGKGIKFNQMTPGTYAFRMNIPVKISSSGDSNRNVNIPVDVVIMPKNASPRDFPILIEAKSAGDFTNVNKRRKEEAQKMNQLKGSFGNDIKFGLFLCGYFDSGYLGYEAAEGIDWVWEHRIDDLDKYGL